MSPKNVSAESAIHRLDLVDRTLSLKGAFSACLHCDLNSWGDAPGWYETAPLALNSYNPLLRSQVTVITARRDASVDIRVRFALARWCRLILCQLMQDLPPNPRCMLLAAVNKDNNA